MADDSHPVRGDRTAAWEGRSWTSRDGLKLFYRDYTGSVDGPPLLCLHGLTRNSRDFERFADYFAGGLRILAPDFRGRGLSDRDSQPGRYVPMTYAADILQLLDEIAIAQAVFVGTSLGGLVTMLVAGLQPQRIAGAVLNDVGPELDERGLERIRSYVGKPMRFRDWDDAADYVAAINGNLPESYGREDWLRAARRLCREEDGAIVFDYDMAIAEPFNRPGGGAVDAWPLYRQLTRAPLLVLRGEHSDLLSPATAQAMVAAHPNVELVTVPGVGHPPELTEPEAVAAIDRLLQRVAASAAAGRGVGSERGDVGPNDRLSG